MLTYSFDNRNGESLYEYLYQCIKNDILSGRLSSHEKLPSKRTFANNLGISIITIQNTYGQLMAEGYIYSKPKSGYFVSEIPHQLEMKKDSFSGKSLPGSVAPVPSQEKINLISNHTAEDNFPFSIWAKLMRQILSEQDSHLLITPPTGGVSRLRNAIAKHLHDFRGISCSPEQIIVGAGSEYLYNLIVQLLGRDKIYGLENPGSKKIRSIYQALGVELLPLSMDQDGVCLPEEGSCSPNIMHISPSHHFPTGIVTSASRRYSLLQWACESDSRYIIEDDYDSEFRLQGRPIPSLFSMDTTDKVIYFNTFTKSLASTIRISYMVLPQHLLDLFYHKLGFYSCTVSNFEQYTLAEFITGQYFEKHINRMRNHYRSLRDGLIQALAESELAERVEILEEDSGLHFLLKLHTDDSDSLLKEKAREKGVAVAFLSDYYNWDFPQAHEHHAGTAIINYSGLKKSDIPDTVLALAEAWT